MLLETNDDPSWGEITVYGAVVVGGGVILFLLIKSMTSSQAAEKNGQDKEDSTSLASKSQDQILTQSGNLVVLSGIKMINRDKA